MSIAHGHVLKKYGFPCTIRAVLGSHGIVVKCTAAIVFPTEDSRAPARPMPLNVKAKALGMTSDNHWQALLL